MGKNTSKIFQCFRLVKFIKKFKTGVKNMKIEKIITFDKHLPKLLLVFISRIIKVYLVHKKIIKVADLTHFSTIRSLFFKRNRGIPSRMV